MTKFFDEQTDQSAIKAKIVATYFWQWGKVMLGSQKKQGEKKVKYVDLFAGPGRYENGATSTPLLILQQAINDEQFRDALETIFNDADRDTSSALRQQINNLPGVETLTHEPKVWCEEVGDGIVAQFQESKLPPTLMFVDPWGYKGLSLRLIQSVLKDWGCECIFFFNYNRINMGAGNEFVEEHIDALFGKERATNLRKELAGLSPDEREFAIVEALTEALQTMGGKYVLPFRFRRERGKRTSHHLFFVSKHPLGYEIMKSVMAEESSNTHQGVATFEYNPAADQDKFPLLFDLNRPLDDLAELLLKEYAGRTLSVDDLYHNHNVGRPYTRANYKDVLRNMELAGQIEADPPHKKRRKRKGVVTFADGVKVTFPE